MKNPRGRPRKFDPDVALNKAMLVFWQRGLSATSLDDLSLAMEMNRPSIYNAFGNKEAIYRAAFAQFCRQMERGFDQTLNVETDLRKGLIKFYDQAIRLYCSGELALGCLVMCTAPVEVSVHPEVKEDLKVLIALIDKKLELRVKDAIRYGDFPADSDPKLTAQLIQGVLHSLAIRARAQEPQSSLKKLARFAVSCLPS
ncbi:MAG: TetR/AcrR family transcriptional regulator [Proteobacteria bacterium]|nr:TetR/AcrR family transcriptional regulator [Pseudomonadota bacterium]